MARMEIFEWGPLLRLWSEEWLEARAAEDPEEFQDLDEDLVQNRWLGFAPADPARLAALDERVRGLGIEVPLPPSLRAFLETTDGWRHAGGFVYLLAGAEGIGSYGDPHDLQPLYEEYLDEDPPEEEVLLAGDVGPGAPAFPRLGHDRRAARPGRRGRRRRVGGVCPSRVGR